MSLWQPRGLIQTGRTWRRPQTTGGGGVSQVRVTFKAASATTSTITRCSIGLQAGAGDEYDTASTPVELLFSSVSGFSISSGATITSDWANLIVSSTVGTVFTVGASADEGGWTGYGIRNVIPVSGGSVPVIVCLDVGAAGTLIHSDGGTGSDSYYKSSFQSSTADATGNTGPYPVPDAEYIYCVYPSRHSEARKVATTWARPVPIKGADYRVYFPILDADGDLMPGATGLDSERSLDGATFADCTNEAVEVATASGMYYLELTAAEMTADAVCVIVKTTSSGAKTTPIVLYPQEAGDIKVDVQSVDTAGTVGVIRGTITGGGTTNPTATIVPATFAVVGNQFKGRIITFDATTTTAALKGQATDITANASATAGTAVSFTVTALTTAPASGDTFSIT